MKTLRVHDLILRSASLTLLVFLGIAGCFGGGLLIADPQGGYLGLSTSLLAETLFSDYFVPGLLLFIIIGIGNLTAAVAVLRMVPWFPFLLAADGACVTIWILVQMTFVQAVVPQQFTIATIGIVLLALGILQWQSSGRSQ
jgi:hypothetical protein